MGAKQFQAARVLSYLGVSVEGTSSVCSLVPHSCHPSIYRSSFPKRLIGQRQDLSAGPSAPGTGVLGSQTPQHIPIHSQFSFLPLATSHRCCWNCRPFLRIESRESREQKTHDQHLKQTDRASPSNPRSIMRKLPAPLLPRPFLERSWTFY